MRNVGQIEGQKQRGVAVAQWGFYDPYVQVRARGGEWRCQIKAFDAGQTEVLRLFSTVAIIGMSADGVHGHYMRRSGLLFQAVIFKPQEVHNGLKYGLT